MNALRTSTASKLLVLASLCLLRALPAFGSQTRHGDAVLVDEHGLPFFPEPADHLDFPRTPLNVSNTYRYRVVDLPQVIYPSAFLLEVPEEEADFGVRREHPWSQCVFRASLITASGQVFLSRTYHLGRDRHGTQSSSHGRYALGFLFTDYSVGGTTSLPHHLSYTLKLEVIRPSARQSDMLAVVAFTVVHPKRPNQAIQRTPKAFGVADLRPR